MYPQISQMNTDVGKTSSDDEHYMWIITVSVKMGVHDLSRVKTCKFRGQRKIAENVGNSSAAGDFTLTPPVLYIIIGFYPGIQRELLPWYGLYVF